MSWGMKLMAAADRETPVGELLRTQATHQSSSARHPVYRRLLPFLVVAALTHDGGFLAPEHVRQGSSSGGHACKPRTTCQRSACTEGSHICIQCHAEGPDRCVRGIPPDKAWCI